MGNRGIVKYALRVLLFSLFVTIGWGKTESTSVYRRSLTREKKIIFRSEDERNRTIHLMAAAFATECRPNDTVCAKMVYVVLWYRTRIANIITDSSSISMYDTLSLKYQFSGIWLKKEVKTISDQITNWQDYAEQLTTGNLTVNFPFVTHYATESRILETPWGREANTRNCEMYAMPDKHIMVGACPGDTYLGFRIKDM